MKTTIVLLGVAGLIVNTISASFRFEDGRTADGFAWVLLGFFVLMTALTTARDW